MRHPGTTGWGEVKDNDLVMDICWHMERESSELAYSWDSKSVGKTEIVDDRNSVEYN